MPDTASTTMTGASQGMAIGGPVGAAIGGVVGFFQGRSARKREQRRKRREKAFAIKAQTQALKIIKCSRKSFIDPNIN